jgi:hypothetical protein
MELSDMIREPPADWNREKAPMANTVVRQAADVASAGASAARSLLWFARAVFCGFFALIWGWAGLAAGLIGGNLVTLIGAGGAGVLMAWLAKRSIDKALGRA